MRATLRSSHVETDLALAASVERWSARRFTRRRSGFRVRRHPAFCSAQPSCGADLRLRFHFQPVFPRRNDRIFDSRGASPGITVAGMENRKAGANRSNHRDHAGRKLSQLRLDGGDH